MAEQSELTESLKDAGINLGSRSLLRYLASRTVYSDDSILPERVEQQPERRSSQSIEANASGSHEGRRLQTGGGFSLEVAAIVFTGVIGMIGYVVQAQSAQKATRAQASLERDAAEAEKRRARAAKQLERVQDQMRLFVMPLYTEAMHMYWAIASAARELQLNDFLTLYEHDYASFPLAPHTDVFAVSSRQALNRGIAAQVAAPFFKLSPNDVDVLTSDPTKRQRYTELVEFTWLPPLRRIARIIATESHLNETTSMPEFLAVMPGDVVLSMAASTNMGTNQLLWYAHVYIGQLESLLGRWAGGDYEILQVSRVPCPHTPQSMVRWCPPCPAVSRAA